MDDLEGNKVLQICENLVHVATIIGKLQHSEYLKPAFLDTIRWAIRPLGHICNRMDGCGIQD